MLGRRVLAGLIIALAVLASALAGTVRRDRAHPGDFFALFLLDLLAVLVGGVTAAGYLAARRDRARGLLGVGLYLLLVAAAFAVLFPRWLPTDNAILGAALLAGLLADAGAGLALAGAALLGGRSAAIGGAGALLAFLGVTALSSEADQGSSTGFALPRVQIDRRVAAVLAPTAWGSGHAPVAFNAPPLPHCRREGVVRARARGAAGRGRRRARWRCRPRSLR